MEVDDYIKTLTIGIYDYCIENWDTASDSSSNKVNFKLSDIKDRFPTIHQNNLEKACELLVQEGKLTIPPERYRY